MNELSPGDSVLTSVVAPASPETFVARGPQRFERLRRPLSFAAVAALITLLFVGEPTPGATPRIVETVVGFGLTVVAVVGRLWCAVYIAGRKNAELCAFGPYSLCRNPLYGFSSLGVVGIVLATHHLALAVGAFCLFWFYHFQVIRSEEVRLTDIFGEAFAAYCERVPCVWPRLGGYRDVPTLNLNTRPLFRAFLEVIWFFVVWLCAHLVFAGA